MENKVPDLRTILEYKDQKKRVIATIKATHRYLMNTERGREYKAEYTLRDCLDKIHKNYLDQCGVSETGLNPAILCNLIKTYLPVELNQQEELKLVPDTNHIPHITTQMVNNQLATKISEAITEAKGQPIVPLATFS